MTPRHLLAVDPRPGDPPAPDRRLGVVVLGVVGVAHGALPAGAAQRVHEEVARLVAALVDQLRRAVGVRADVGVERPVGGGDRQELGRTPWTAHREAPLARGLVELAEGDDAPELADGGGGAGRRDRDGLRGGGQREREEPGEEREETAEGHAA